MGSQSRLGGSPGRHAAWTPLIIAMSGEKTLIFARRRPIAHARSSSLMGLNWKAKTLAAGFAERHSSTNADM
jgi:hypothetical protein